MERLKDENSRVRAMRDRLEKTILSTVPNTHSQRRQGTAPAEHEQHRVRFRGSGGNFA